MTAAPGPFATDPGELLRHDQWLRRLARRLVHGRDVDDLVQDTWTVACDARPDDARPLRSWLGTVVRRLAARHHRTAARRETRERRAAGPDVVPSTETTVAMLELQRRVAAAVVAMAEPNRTAVLLRYYHGLDTATIAARCACSEEAVRKRLERGLDELRLRLRESDGPGWRGSAPMLALAGADLAPVAGTAVVVGGGLWIMSKLKITAAMALVAVAGLFGYWVTSMRGDPPPAIGAEPDADPATAELRRGAAREPAPTATARPPERVAVTPAPESRSRAPLCRGRVLDPAGQPLAGVPLVLAAKLPESLDPAPKLGAKAAPARFDLAALPAAGESDGDGGFAIVAPADRYLLAGPGFATLRTPLVGVAGADDLVLVAAPAVAVQGLVVDATGQPLAGVRIEVRVPPLGEFPVVLDRTRDNSPPPAWSLADGTFELDHLAAGLGELTFRRQGYVSAKLAVPPASRAAERVVLAGVATAHLVVQGRVLDLRELAIAGAVVGLHGKTTRTEEDGSFQLVFHRPEEAPQSFSHLFAAHPGFQTQVLAGFGARLADPAQRDVVIHLAGPALTIAGRVLDAAGAPKRDALVYLWNEPAILGNSTAEELAMRADAPVHKVGAEIRVWAKTDAHGLFELRGLREQSYRLRVLVPRPQAAITSEPVPAGSRGIELRLPAELVHAKVAGRVVTQSGTPVAGVRLLSHLELYVTGNSRFFDDGASGVSDADGRFELRDVPRTDAYLAYSGDHVVPGTTAIAADRPILEQRIVVVQRCHLRVQVDPGHGAERFQVLDAAGKELEIMQIGTDGYSSARQWQLEAGRSGVLSVGEQAVTLVLLGAKGEIVRLPLQLAPGKVTVVRY